MAQASYLSSPIRAPITDGRLTPSTNPFAQLPLSIYAVWINGRVVS